MSEAEAVAVAVSPETTTPEQAIDQHFASVKDEAAEAVRKAVADAEKASNDNDEPAPAKKIAKEKPANDAEHDPANDNGGEEVQETKRVLVKDILRERARERKERERLRDERQQYEAAKGDLAQMRAEMERERQWLQELRRSPEKAFAEAGWKPDEVILDLAKLDTPEGQASRQMRQLQEENKQLRTAFEQWQQQQLQQAEEAKRAQAQAAIRHTEEAFIATALDAEKFPSLARAYKFRQRSLVNEAHEVGAEYHRRTGVWASHEEICDYLESLISGDAGASSKNGAQKQARSGTSPQQRGQGSARPLNTSAASERRTIAADDAEGLSEDERIAAAKAAVKQTLRERT